MAVQSDPAAPRVHVYGRPGYLVEVSEHPLSRRLDGYRKPVDLREGRRCAAPRRVRVRVTTTPVSAATGAPLNVAAADPAGRDFLRRDGVIGNVRLDSYSSVVRAHRDGIPFVERGDRLVIVLQDCVATEAAGPGMAGLRRPVADELRGVRHR